MDSKSNNKEPMDTDVLQIVLEEFAAIQEEGNKKISHLITKAEDLNAEIRKLKQQSNQKSDASIFGEGRILDAIERGFKELKKIISELKLGKIERYFKILLFPEQDRKLFYKIVFGHWLLYLTIMLLLNNTYKFMAHRSDNQKEIQIEQINEGHLNKSWQYLYEHGDKGTKHLIENTYRQSNSIGNR